MRFYSPQMFLFLIPVFFYVYWRFIRRSKYKASVGFSYLDTITKNKTYRGMKVYLHRLVNVFRVFAMILIVVALARPQTINEKENRYVEGIDIMILIDTSTSMLTEDFKPNNRLFVAKKVIDSFIKGRRSDKIGFIVFSGESYTKCPLTLDYKILNQSLVDIKINDRNDIKQGTAIGMAIANAVARLKDSKAKSRVIILLTDGENNTGSIDPVTASELAGDLGIKIYAVGIGKDGKVPYPMVGTDFFGNKVKRYTTIHNKLDTKIFKLLAKNSKGEFFRATGSKALKRIFKKIDALEKTKMEVTKYVRYGELYVFFLYLAFILLAIEIILSNTILRKLP